MPGVEPLKAGRRPIARLLGLGGLVATLAACSPDPGRDPATFAIPSATAAPIRMEICKPGTFIGTMTVNCPQVAR